MYVVGVVVLEGKALLVLAIEVPSELLVLLIRLDTRRPLLV